MYTRWTEYRNQLQSLGDLSISRNAFRCETPKSIQLHGFCDTSQQVYGACIYLRIESASENTQVNLCAKSKIAPLKVITAARLELCAAVLLAELMYKVVHCLKCQSDLYYWSDSKIVLA